MDWYARDGKTLKALSKHMRGTIRRIYLRFRRLLLAFATIPILLWTLYFSSSDIQEFFSFRAIAASPERSIVNDDIGFYLQVYAEPEARVESVVADVRWFYPDAPLLVVSDGGKDYSALCARQRCSFFREPENIGVTDDLVHKAGTRQYRCEKQMARIVNASKIAATSWMVLLETDVRIMHAVRGLPPGDINQMSNVRNSFSPAFLDLVDPALGNDPWYSSTGGTVFRGDKLIEAVELRRVLETEAWKAAERVQYLQTDDICLSATFQLAGYRLRSWPEYMQFGWQLRDDKLGRVCLLCITWCFRENCRYYSKYFTEHPMDSCARTCETCPAFLHAVKRHWCEYHNMHHWHDGVGPPAADHFPAGI
jgi:hypothetical protein